MVKDLDKSDFEMLGVTRLGDQKRLRLLCNLAPVQQPSSKLFNLNKLPKHHAVVQVPTVHWLISKNILSTCSSC